MSTDPNPQPNPEQEAAKAAEKQIEKIQKDKEFLKPEGKETIKETIKAENKEHKDFKDVKEEKEHKEQKEHKEHKEQKDHKPEVKENKDHKEQKEQKEHKEHKEQKDHKPEVKEHKIEAKEKDHFEGPPMPAEPLGVVDVAAAKLLESGGVAKYKLEIVEKSLVKELKEWKDHHEYVVGPIGYPGPGPLEQRLAALEQTVVEMSHFIQASQRPDLSGGALSGEPDVGQDETPTGDDEA